MTASGKTGGSIDQPANRFFTKMIVRANSPQTVRWFCFVLALATLTTFLVSSFVWYENDRSGEAVYRKSRIERQEITRLTHPAEFRESQTRLVLESLFSGVLCVIAFRFFRKLGE